MTPQQIEILRHRYGGMNLVAEVHQPATSNAFFGRYVFLDGKLVAEVKEHFGPNGTPLAVALAEMPQVIMRLCDEIEKLRGESRCSVCGTQCDIGASGMCHECVIELEAGEYSE